MLSLFDIKKSMCNLQFSTFHDKILKVFIINNFWVKIKKNKNGIIFASAFYSQLVELFVKSARFNLQEWNIGTEYFQC